MIEMNFVSQSRFLKYFIVILFIGLQFMLQYYFLYSTVKQKNLVASAKQVTLKKHYLQLKDEIISLKSYMKKLNTSKRELICRDGDKKYLLQCLLKKSGLRVEKIIRQSISFAVVAVGGFENFFNFIEAINDKMPLVITNFLIQKNTLQSNLTFLLGVSCYEASN